MQTRHRTPPWRAAIGRIVVAAALTALMTAPSAANAASPARLSSAATRVSTITLPDGSRHTLVTPAGLQVTLYASGLTTPRFMALGPHGDVFVTERDAGILAVIPHGSNGRVVTLLRGLTDPHGVAFHAGRLYVAETGQVDVMGYNATSHSIVNPRVFIANLPAGGRHFTRTIAFAPNGDVYVSVGSSCNECVESDPRRAAILRYRSDGTGMQIYARGLRNAVGLAIQPGTGRLWATDNGRDLLGENIPPDEIDLIQQGGNFGWPYCWGDRQRDPAVSAAAGYCANTIPPAVALQAHSAPLGLAFSTNSTGTLLPARYRGGLFVAYHGSTYRMQPTGYKVVYVPVQGTHAGAPRDVVTGWLPAGAASASAVWGRPVGVLVAADGSLLISDDQAGVIYRLAPAGR